MTTPHVTTAAASHLPLVGHVVSQLDARYPRHVDRTLLWTLGAWGLVSAIEQLDAAAPSFTADTLRAIRDVIVDATRIGAPDLAVTDADDADLAVALGLTVTQLEVLRTRALPSHRAAAEAHVAARREVHRAARAAGASTVGSAARTGGIAAAAV